MSDGIDIPIRAKVDGKDVGLLEGSIAALRKELSQARKDFEAAAPQSQPWRDAASRVIDLGTRINDAVRPLREMAAAQQQLTGAVTASVNPWTTASKGWDQAAHNLMILTERARSAKAALEAQARAAEQAARAQRVDFANARQDAVADAQRQMLHDMREAEAQTLRLKSAHEKLQPVNQQTGKTSSETARGILEVSRAFEDAQYGIAGVLNNLPNIITMFGGGAGLAGALSIAAVAATVLWRNLGKRDWSGTWIGDMGDALKEMLTGMTEAEREAREIMDAPDSWRKTGADAVEEYKTATEKALTREIELLRQRNALLKEGDELRNKEAQHAERLFRLNNPNIFEKGTEKWAQREEELISSQYREGQAERSKRADEAYRDDWQATQEKTIAERNLKRAEETKRGLIRREEIQRRMASNVTASMEDSKRIEEWEAGIKLADDLGMDSPKLKRLAADAKARIQKRMQDAAAMTQELATLAGRQNGESMEDAHKRADEAVKKRQDELTAASDKAAEATRKRVSVAGDVNREDLEARAKLEAQRQEIGIAQFEHASESYGGKDRKIFTPPTDNLTPPAPPPAVSSEEFERTRKGLVNMAQRSGNAPGNERIRDGARALDAAYSDGQGDTAAEGAILERMRQQIASGKQSTEQAVEAALRAMEAIQADGADMQRKLTGALTSFSQTLRSMGNQIDQLKSEQDAYRDSRR